MPWKCWAAPRKQLSSCSLALLRLTTATSGTLGSSFWRCFSVRFSAWLVSITFSLRRSRRNWLPLQASSFSLRWQIASEFTSYRMSISLSCRTAALEEQLRLLSSYSSTRNTSRCSLCLWQRQFAWSTSPYSFRASPSSRWWRFWTLSERRNASRPWTSEYTSALSITWWPALKTSSARLEIIMFAISLSDSTTASFVRTW